MRLDPVYGATTHGAADELSSSGAPLPGSFVEKPGSMEWAILRMTVRGIIGPLKQSDENRAHAARALIKHGQEYLSAIGEAA